MTLRELKLWPQVVRFLLSWSSPVKRRMPISVLTANEIADLACADVAAAIAAGNTQRQRRAYERARRARHEALAVELGRGGFRQ